MVAQGGHAIWWGKEKVPLGDERQGKHSLLPLFAGEKKLKDSGAVWH